MSVVVTRSVRCHFSSPPQQGQRMLVTGTSTGSAVAAAGGAARRWKGPCPGFRPGRLGWALRLPLENGGADRALLTEYESKQLLKAYDIPTVDTRIAITETEALQAADEIGYPIVLKVYSLSITHKTDVGGVQLNLRDAGAVKTAFQAIRQSVTEKVGAENFQGVTVQPMVKLDGYELIVGSSLDEQFGPVILFGTGGQLVEVFEDRALALPPLNSTLALRLMEQTKILQARKGAPRL